MSIFSVGRFVVGCTLLAIIAEASVSTPSLPANISRVMMNLDAVVSRGVIPVVSPTVAIAGHALERYVAESNLRRFYRADDERRGQREEEIDGEQRHRLFDQRQVESAFADDDVLMSADGRVEPEEDDDHRRDLDAARGGTAVAAYEHQYLHKQNTAVRKLRKSDGVEARRPRRDRLEEADEKTFAGALSFQHAAAVFERKEQQCGHEHQQKRRPQHYAGVQTVLPVTETLVYDKLTPNCHLLNNLWKKADII